MADKVRVPQLMPNSIEEAAQKRNIWQITPEPGVTVDDILKKEYWAHTSGCLTPGDRIEAIPQDRSYYAEFIVLGKDKHWATVKLLGPVIQIFENQEEAEAVADTGYTVAFAGPHKWRVVRNNDKQVMSKGHDSREQAEAWLKEFKKAA